MYDKRGFLLDHEKEYQRWLQNSDEETKLELMEMSSNLDEIIGCFSRHLDFGTAGIRGKIGPGPNRINKYLVGQVVQAFSNILNNENIKSSVIIAYDSRNKSNEFAKKAAVVLAANKIKVYLFDKLRPVPLLSFGVRFLKTTGGIMITASHNPEKYNGLKIYGSDGAQIGPEIADLIFEEIKKVDIFSGVKKIDFKSAVCENKIQIVSEKIDSSYLSAIKLERLNEKLTNDFGKDITIIYTPLHGAGNKLVRRVLDEIGFKNVIVVPEQEKPDGNFPTVKCPNPECLESFELSIKLAKERNAELIIGTDPDADRIGILVKDKKENFAHLSGNQVGVLLTEYILSQRIKNNNLPKNAFVAKSIVSSNMVKKIADFYNVKLYETLTGFKYIGEIIKMHEKEKTGVFVFGFEESYGYLCGNHARDKDAVEASMLISEMFLYYKFNGLSLLDKLEKLYEKYGFFLENTTSITIEGIHGIEKIESIMKKFRDFPPRLIGQKVVGMQDFLLSSRLDFESMQKTKINFPKSNVLYFEIEGGSNFVIRPSGTEPKIKFYSLAKGETKEKIDRFLDECQVFIKCVQEENFTE